MSEYLVSKTIEVPSRSHLGPEQYGRTLRAGPNFTGPMVMLTQPEPTLLEKEIQGVWIHDLTLIGNGECDGIQYTADPVVPGSNPRSCVLERLRIEGCLVGLHVEAAEGGAIRDCKFIRNSIGIRVGDFAGGLRLDHVDFRHNGIGLSARALRPSNEWLVSRCHFESNTGMGLVLGGVSGWTLDTCKFEGNAGHVVLDWPGTSDISLRPDNHRFASCAFNATSGGQVGIDVRHGNSLTFEALTASARLTTLLKFAANAGWHSLILGKTFKGSQAQGLDGKATCVPGLL